MKYYSLTKILATRSDINLIIGMRSNGKTFGTLKYFLKQYKKTKKRFCYIRRYEEDIKTFRMEQLFAPLLEVVKELFGDGFTISYSRHKFYLVNANGTKVDTIGYCLALSTASHYKSTPYNNVGYILYDEFIPTASEIPLRDEKEKYESVLSTVIRDKQDVVIFCCANTVSKFNWLFIYYGFDINKVEQGQIVTKEIPKDDTILRVSLEYCEYNEEIGKKSSKYTTSAMITKGLWEIPEVDEIPTAKNELVKDRLLFSIYDPDSDITIGCFLRRSRWITLEQNEETLLYYDKVHVREFLIIKTIDFRSNYYHLSDQKSLNYHTYNDMDLMLKDIKEECDIDFERELYMGRVFCNNKFTADYFNHAYIEYSRVTPRQLL